MSRFTSEQLFEHLRAALVELFEIDPARITPQAQLYADLDIDSIDAVDLLLRLKEITGRQLEPAAFKQARTVQDVVSALHAALSPAGT